MKRFKLNGIQKFIFTLVIALVLAITPILGVFPVKFGWATPHLAFALTSQNVSVNATPAYVSISNAPTTFAFGTIAAGASPNSTAGWFTITNSSTVNIDISLSSNEWSSGGTTWTWGAPAADTGRIMGSSANGGVGGSSGAEAFDIEASAGGNLMCDGVTSVTNPTWEIELEAPSSYTAGDLQTTTLTLTAVAE